MSSPQMTRMLGFLAAAYAKAGVAPASASPIAAVITRTNRCRIISLLPGVAPLLDRAVRPHYSKVKIFFQSFFMLMTVQPCFFASS